MPEIKKEYPEGLHNIEMELVRMLKDHRSWHDYQEIGSALWRVRYSAKQLTSERNALDMSSESENAK